MSTMIDPTLPREGVATARHQPLMLLLCASALGVVLDRYLTVAELSWWSLTIAAFVIWLVLQCWRPRFATIALLIAFAGAFAAWHHVWWYRYPATEIGRSASLTIQPVMLEGIALTHVRLLPAPAQDPLSTIPRGDRCLLDVQITSARHGTRWQLATGQAPLVVDGHLLG
ncbi:MAG TPA: hypothetical protein VL096_11260, partial [Pirellulaceae bacterium]|nr:hypothetical protein [Pirellulaceae bacterium]